MTDILARDAREASRLKKRRMQRPGVFLKGPSWFVQVRRDFRAPGGQVERKKETILVGAAVGPNKLTRGAAQRKAEQEILPDINFESLHPATLATVRHYWEQVFERDHVAHLETGGQKHYAWCKRWVLGQFGAWSLRDVTHRDVQAMVAQLSQPGAAAVERPPVVNRGGKWTVKIRGRLVTLEAKNQAAAEAEAAPMILEAYPDKGLARESIRHIVVALHALYSHAQVDGAARENPAERIRLPRKVKATPAALNFAEVCQLIAALSKPYADMVALATLTSMNAAEVLGLKWKWVNLEHTVRLVEGDVLPGHSLAVRGQFVHGRYGETKTPNRKRVIAITPLLVERLTAHRADSPFQGAEDYVFCTSTGRPYQQNNVAKRHISKLGQSLFGKQISWHTFRRCAATFSAQVEMPIEERVALLGHSSALMNLHYTGRDIERRRVYLNQVEALLLPPSNTMKPV